MDLAQLFSGYCICLLEVARLLTSPTQEGLKCICGISCVRFYASALPLAFSAVKAKQLQLIVMVQTSDAVETACGATGQVCCRESEFSDPTCTDSEFVCNVSETCTACGAPDEPCCTNKALSSGSDMCPNATATQNLVCSALEDDTIATGAATCVACGKADQECCVGESTFSDRTCGDGLACTAEGCKQCGYVVSSIFCCEDHMQQSDCPQDAHGIPKGNNVPHAEVG